MDTQFCTLTGANEDKEIYERAGEIIRRGGLVAFPTETVYGLGADGLNPEASARIYAAKGRPSDNPLIVHIADIADLDRIVKEVPESAKQLAKAFWPGPLTLIFHKKEIVPDTTTGGLDTVAVRMPDHEMALSFIRAAGGYIAAPSANLSGRPSPTKALHVKEDMDGRIDMILDGGDVGIGVESTIVDLTGEVPMILRPGFINVEMLSMVLGEVAIDPAIEGSLSDGVRPKAPGMKYKHYAPKGELYVIRGDAEKVANRMNELTAKLEDAGEKVGILATEENLGRYTGGCVRCVGSRREEETIARHLFAVLREFDDLGVSTIYSEDLDTPHMGMAVMNRLLKAAAHRVIDV